MRLSSLIRYCTIVGTLIISLSGCVTIRSEPLPQERRKAVLHQLPPYPDGIITSKEKPLKYDADELWIFRHPSDEGRWYFKGDRLIAIDRIIYETL